MNPMCVNVVEIFLCQLLHFIHFAGELAALHAENSERSRRTVADQGLHIELRASEGCQHHCAGHG